MSCKYTIFRNEHMLYNMWVYAGVQGSVVLNIPRRKKNYFGYMSAAV